ncbi:MAG: hypothetical protein JXR64_06105 [Spirochaetales bacterium]|nr:hypothetical protein [Spirochaetales bacterium]
MKKIVLIVAFLAVTTVNAFSRTDMRLLSSYILPIENSAFNQSLVLGLGAGFWGIFEFTGNAYLEIDHSDPDFWDKFQQPNVFSAGVGMNIPMGGFRFKTDYQRFFAVNDSTSELSVSKYTDSYKLGIGLELTDDVELEFYHRTLLDSRLDLIKGDKQGFIGLGLNISL